MKNPESGADHNYVVEGSILFNTFDQANEAIPPALEPVSRTF